MAAGRCIYCSKAELKIKGKFKGGLRGHGVHGVHGVHVVQVGSWGDWD